MSHFWLSRCIRSHLVSKMKVSFCESFGKIFFVFGCSDLGLTGTQKVQGFICTSRLMVLGGYSKKKKKKQGTAGFALGDWWRGFCFLYCWSQRIKKDKLIMEGSVWSFFLTVVEDDGEFGLKTGWIAASFSLWLMSRAWYQAMDAVELE